MDELKASHREYLRNARKKVMDRCAESDKPEPDEAELRALVETDAALEMLREKHQRVVQKLDEKIAIAAQSYDLVDHHIRRLDQDLDAYAALLKQAGEFEEDKVFKKVKKTAQQPLTALPDKKQGSRSSGTTSSLAAAAGNGGSSSTASTSSGRKRSTTEAALDVPAMVTSLNGSQFMTGITNRAIVVCSCTACGGRPPDRPERAYLLQLPPCVVRPNGRL